MKAKTLQLAKAPIPRLLYQFSAPAIVGTLINATYNLVDRIFVGQAVGELGLASVSVTFPFMMVLMAFGMLTAVGTNAQLSIRLGEQRIDQAEELLGQALYIFIVMYLVTLLLGNLFIDQILTFSGATPEILPMARTYLRIILAGSFFNSLSFGANNFIRSEGGPLTAMMTMLVGAIVNVILNPIFLFVFKWGVAGSAWATFIAQAMAALWVFHYYVGGKSHLKIRRKYICYRARLFRRVVAIGSPSCVMHVVGSALNILINNQLKRYGGDMAITAIGVVGTMFSINMLFFMPMIGIGHGMQPIIGYNYGAKNYERVKSVVKLGLLICTLIGLLAFYVTQVHSVWLFHLFAKEGGPFVTLGSYAIRRFMFCFPLIGMTFVASQFFQSIGKARYALFLTLLRQVIIILPLLLILPQWLGLEGVWLSNPISDAVAFTASTLLLLSYLPRLSATSKTLNDQGQPLSAANAE